MQLYSILILVQWWRFMEAGVRWDFGTRQQISGFLEVFKISLPSMGHVAKNRTLPLNVIKTWLELNKNVWNPGNT